MSAAGIDTIRRVETPEGVELELRTAGPVARAAAYMVDQLIRMAAYLVVGMLLGIGGDAGMGIFLIFMFVAEWFYPVLFEVLRRGRTPGKSVMNLAVVRDDGRPIDWTTSIVRNFMRTADFLPFAYLFGFLAMASDRDFKRLGDLAAGTVVVYDDHVSTGIQLPPGPTFAPPVPLQLAEQRAIVHFAERGAQLSHERHEELAALLTPLVGVEQRSNKLVAMARWILGYRDNQGPTPPQRGWS